MTKKMQRRPIKAGKGPAESSVPVRMPAAELLAPDGTPISVILERSNAMTRREAGMAYVTSLEGMTIKQLHGQPDFAHLSLRTLEYWSAQDRWAERRRDFLDKAFARAERTMGTEFVQARVRELRLLEKVVAALDRAGWAEDANGNLTLTLQPKTLEGWARTRLDYSEALDKLRGQLAAHLLPDSGDLPEPTVTEEERPTVLHPNMRMRPTENEAVAMAVLLMRMRREEVEKQMAIDSELDSPRKKRPPPPVEGEEDGEAA